MRLLRKLTSKKGQLSMEVGLLIAAAILVAAIIAYYYTTRTKAVSERVGSQVGNTTSDFQDSAEDIVKNIVDVTNTIE